MNIVSATAPELLEAQKRLADHLRPLLQDATDFYALFLIATTTLYGVYGVRPDILSNIMEDIFSSTAVKIYDYADGKAVRVYLRQ